MSSYYLTREGELSESSNDSASHEAGYTHEQLVARQRTVVGILQGLVVKRAGVPELAREYVLTLASAVDKLATLDGSPVGWLYPSKKATPK